MTTEIMTHLSSDDDKVDYESDWILPGFIDIHNHGFGGATSVLEYWYSYEINRSTV